jgi:hypothetical protein
MRYGRRGRKMIRNFLVGETVEIKNGDKIIKAQIHNIAGNIYSVTTEDGAHITVEESDIIGYPGGELL